MTEFPILFIGNDFAGGERKLKAKDSRKIEGMFQWYLKVELCKSATMDVIREFCRNPVTANE